MQKQREIEKLIIENRTDLSMYDVLSYIAKVISEGRISDDGKQYCYHTSFLGGIGISSFRNKKSDRLVVWTDKVLASSISDLRKRST